MSERLGVTFARVRNHYRRHHAEIMASPNDWFDDAYSWEYEAGICLTPIERALWLDIRAESLVLYPQYPVGRFFVDFGNPVLKVAIECDGERWHLDAAKDADRQAQIESLGWSVYRISGKGCLTDHECVEDEYGRAFIRTSAARLFVRDVAAKHPGLARAPQPGGGSAFFDWSELA